jgi:hypothetical protein
LTHIAKKDSRIHALILKEINFKELLYTNMFNHNQEAMIPIAAEFLKCFQSEAGFLQDLYAIFIDMIDRLPTDMISYNGYEALVGMLKWSLPLDTDRSL